MNALKEFIDDSNLTQREAAEKAGLKSASTVNQHISGKRNMSIGTAIKYHRAFNIPLWLLRPDIWKKSEEENFV